MKRQSKMSGIRKKNYICTLEKFIPDFIEFVREQFPDEDNRFITVGDISRFPYSSGEDCWHFDNWLAAAPVLLKGMIGAEKVVVHGLFSKFLIAYLALLFPLLKKCYWIVWGGDLYQYRNQSANIKNRLKEQFRRFVIPRIGFLVAFIPGDIALARKWYKAQGTHISCFTYPSNTVSIDFPETTVNKELTILVGNSADPENRHIEVLKALSEKVTELDKTKIIVPLSYGPKDHAQLVINYGTSLFGKSFVALTEFMERKSYINLLENCDIALFGHERQQAIGNTISLLGLGKKVHLSNNTVQWDFFKKNEIEVYDLKSIDLTKIPLASARNNAAKIRELFSKERLALDLKPIVTIE